MKNLCPNEEMLTSYLEGRLPDNERAKIEEHVSGCESCIEEFVISGSLIRGGDRPELESVPAKVTQTAVHLVNRRGTTSFGSLSGKLKRYVKDLSSSLSDRFGITPYGEWGLSPIRGSRKVVSKDLIHLKKTFKEMETASKAHIRVHLSKEVRDKNFIRVTLKKAQREISSHPLTTGYALFEDIPFGHYSLNFSKSGEKLGTYRFEVKESGNKSSGKTSDGIIPQ